MSYITLSINSFLDFLQMQYIQPLPGNFVSMDPSTFIDIYGYVATPRIWKQKSYLTWHQGPMYLFEEVISMETLQLIIKLGPRYCSNFQAVEPPGKKHICSPFSQLNFSKLLAKKERAPFG